MTDEIKKQYSFLQDEISEARLKAVPAATLCIDCKTKQEKGLVR